MQHIPLRTAYLCQDCNAVGNDAHQCPACASAALLNLACVLDRKQVRSEKLELTYEFPIPAATFTSKVA
jgi:hypothetical protein